MKDFTTVAFSTSQRRRELEEFRRLPDTKERLLERKVLKPFFDGAPQLSAFIGTYAWGLGLANLLAYEFEIAGDFCADIVVGNPLSQTFVMVELEEAGSHSIFARAGRKSNNEWSRKFEHGFSQLVDWLHVG